MWPHTSPTNKAATGQVPIIVRPGPPQERPELTGPGGTVRHSYSGGRGGLGPGVLPSRTCEKCWQMPLDPLDSIPSPGLN